MSSSRRYTEKEVSRLLGMVRGCGLPFVPILAAVVRQLRRELATRQETIATLNDELERQTLVIERLKRDIAKPTHCMPMPPAPEVTK